MTERFHLGVNYWPQKKAMYWWSNFDRGEAADELSLIAELGLDMVRIFLLWDDFQPDPATVSLPRMRELEQLLDVAADCRLSVNVTFFTGHMSGPNWVPRWLLDSDAPPCPRPVVSAGRVVKSGYRNPFADPDALQAEERLVAEVVGAFKSHPAVVIWNLGNEPDLFALPKSPESGRGWCRRLCERIRETGAEQPVTLGLFNDSVQMSNGFQVHEVLKETDLAVMHGYPQSAPWARSPLDAALVPFLAALTRALSGKPVLMEEFGHPTAAPGDASHFITITDCGIEKRKHVASEEEMAEYLDQVLHRLHREGATGALLWCFADYAPSLFNRPPCDQFVHERHFGLLRSSGTLKPHAEVLRRFAAQQPMVDETAFCPVSLEMTPKDFYKDPMDHCRRLYRDYLLALGEDPDRR